MTTTPEGSTGKNGGVKTLSIRLEPDLHAQLSLIAQLRGSTITDEIRQAIDAHIAAIKASPELVGRADSVLEDIEREASARRAAITTLFGQQAEPEAKAQAGGNRNRGRRPASGTGSDS